MSDLINDIRELRLPHDFLIFEHLKDFISKEVGQGHEYTANIIMEEFIYQSELIIQHELEDHINSQSANWFLNLINSYNIWREIKYIISFDFYIIEGIEDPKLLMWTQIDRRTFFAELYFNLRLVEIKLILPKDTFSEKDLISKAEFEDYEIDEDNLILYSLKRIDFNVSFNFDINEKRIDDLTVNSMEFKFKE